MTALATRRWRVFAQHGPETHTLYVCLLHLRLSRVIEAILKMYWQHPVLEWHCASLAYTHSMKHSLHSLFRVCFHSIFPPLIPSPFIFSTALLFITCFLFTRPSTLRSSSTSISLAFAQHYYLSPPLRDFFTNAQFLFSPCSLYNRCYSCYPNWAWRFHLSAMGSGSFGSCVLFGCPVMMNNTPHELKWRGTRIRPGVGLAMSCYLQLFATCISPFCPVSPHWVDIKPLFYDILSEGIQ